MGVRFRKRPFLFGGAATLPNRRKFERYLLIVLGSRPAVSAIWETVSSLLVVMLWINSRADNGRFGPSEGCMVTKDNLHDFPGGTPAK
jgi:hypothetical protein